VEERIADSRVLTLIRSYLDQGVMDELTLHEPTDRGTPQGAVISPLLANIYLDPLDHLLAESGVEMVRYADDFVLLCRSEAAAQAALARVQTWVGENGLTLHPVKTRLVDATQSGGFDFLGYHFERGYRWPRRKSLDRLKDKVRQLTPRTCGVSLETTIARLNETLQGWFGYFQHGHRTTFSNVDGYVRGRLRSILRKRVGKRGRGRGTDHHTWRTTTSPSWACSAYRKPMPRPVGLLAKLITNWRAGCGRPACPVRREGRVLSPSLPLSWHGLSSPCRGDRGSPVA
jgi:RNA-directed DNA polymerase